MKTKLTLITLLFLASLQVFAQNYDIENIRAAVLSPHNNQAYFFVGDDKVYQYDPKTKKRVIRPLNSGNNPAFKGVPRDVDATLVNPTTKKVFVFRGNNWYRYNMRDGKRERTGILGSDGFKGITGPFDGAVAHGTSGNYAFFKGREVLIYNPKTQKVQYSATIGANNVYKGVPTNIDGVIRWTNGMAYFFKGDYYYRYNYSKQRVDASKRVTGRDGFKNLFPGIDAVQFGKAFVKNYYWEGTSRKPLLGISDPVFSIISEIIDSGNMKKTFFGYNHYEGVPYNLDAALSHNKGGTPYFLKGSTYYRYDPKTRKTTTGIIKTGWDGLPSNIDAAYSSNDGYHYFFKGERWYAYDYNSKRLRNSSGSFIKTAFRGVPNYLDAAIISGNTIYFYKKNTEYVYDRGKRKVIAWNSIEKIAK